jgi:hypothetical protein
MSKPAPTTGMLSVYDGRQCIGFVLPRGRQGFEAARADDQSLGIFPDKRDAVARLMKEPAP